MWRAVLRAECFTTDELLIQLFKAELAGAGSLADEIRYAIHWKTLQGV